MDGQTPFTDCRWIRGGGNPQAKFCRRCGHTAAFTLIEVLVVIAIIGVLVSVLIPALSRSRAMAKSAVCLTRLRTLGQGLVLYTNANRDVLPPARMPKVDDDNWRLRIEGGVKYRPAFLAMMGHEVGLKPFDDPQPSRKDVDRFGQPGDRQNYASSAYVCSETPDWTDERNGSYGYNYQFLGNARLIDEQKPTSYKNWPIVLSQVRSPAECVAIGDSMGTAASFRTGARAEYVDNLFGDGRSGRRVESYGNEGFNLDPPRVDAVNGEMAGFDGDDLVRTAIHPRHAGRGNVLWVDTHAGSESLQDLGYHLDDDGVVNFDGDNRFFSLDHVDRAWTQD
ncbi:MAG: type II secretion system protein [Planctomycetota bacterium]